MASKLSSLTTEKGSGRFMPALLTRMSKGGAPPIAAPTAATSVTSMASASAEPPSARMAATALSELGRPAGGKHDMSAMRGKRGGGCQADAASRPGHQRPAAVEAKTRRFRQSGQCLFRRGGVADIAAAVAADADIGLLGVPDEALEHGKPRSIGADHGAGLVGE